MVIRQAGDLVQKLINQNGIVMAAAGSTVTGMSTAQGYAAIAAAAMQNIEPGDVNFRIEAGDTRHDQFSQFIDAEQTLDAFVAESYARLGIGDSGNANDNGTNAMAEPTPSQTQDQSNITALMNALDEIQIPSPSEKLQNLCLYSPSSPPSSMVAAATTIDPSTSNNDLFAQTLETIHEDSFKQLLYGNIDDLNNLI